MLSSLLCKQTFYFYMFSLCVDKFGPHAMNDTMWASKLKKSRMCGRVWYYWLKKKSKGVKAFEGNLHSDEALLYSKIQSLGHCLFFNPAAENKVKMTVKTCCSVPPPNQIISNGMVNRQSCQSYIHDYPGWNQCSVQNAVCISHACSAVCCCCRCAGIREKADFRNSSRKEFP